MATFHENLVQSFHNFRDKYLKANGNFFKFSYDVTTQKYGFTINGTFHPFNTHPFDTKNDTISYTSNDNSSIFNSGNLGGQSTYAWTAVSKIATGEKHSSLLNKVSTMFKNIRTIAKLIGTTDISSIGNGTLSGGISELKDSLTDKADKTQLPIRASDSFTPIILNANVSNASCSVYVFGYVETVVISFTLSASVSAGTELIALSNLVTNPKGFVPVNFVRFSNYGTFEGYVNGGINSIVALETLPADTYSFSYTYVS